MLEDVIVPSTNSAIIPGSRTRAAPISGVKDGMPASMNALCNTPV